MPNFMFYLFAALTLGSGLMVALNRNAVNAAMSLFLTFVGMAGMFVLLEAYFLAILQVLVYAGAVVVLFAFIVMLLNSDEQPKPKMDKMSTIAATVAFGIMVTGVFWLFSKEQLVSPSLPAEASGSVLKTYGRQLFTTYLLPMQIAGFLLLIAMIGVIVISKRSDRPEVGEEADANN
jgi:NADH-quinone oxidoreductase subunit J